MVYIVYHGTRKGFLESICKDGLHPAKSYSGFDEPTVTSYRGMAGQRAAAMTLMALFLLGGLMIPSASGLHALGEPVFDSANVNGTGCAPVPTSWSHTTASALNRIMFVVVSQLNPDINAAPSAVTYAGQALTLLRTDVDGFGVNARMTLWRLADPAEGTNTVSVTGTISISASVTYSQIAAASVPSHGGQVLAGSNSAEVTTLTNSAASVVYLDFAFGQPNPSSGTFSPGPASGQTARLNSKQDSGCDNLIGISDSRTLDGSMSWTGSWPASQGVTGVQAVALDGVFPVDSGGGNDGGTTTGGGFAGRLVPGFDATCAVSPLDWLVSTPVEGHNEVSIYDGRVEAEQAILYVVSWGDKTQSIEITTPINHTYKEDGLYKLTVRIQYNAGQIDIFITEIDTRANNCALQMFARDYLGIIMMLGVLSILAAVIVTIARRRVKKRKTLRRALLYLGIFSLSVVIAVVAYATAIGTPI